MLIRKTEKSDLPRLLELYGIARRFMRENGNPHQWQTYPPADLLEEDIENGISYVFEEDGTVHGTFVFSVGEDETYLKIWDGGWLNDEPYGVIHRICGDGTVHGLVRQAVEMGFSYTDNIRIDTHRDNMIMQNCLGKLGFVRCGIITIGHDIYDPERIAYQLEKKKYFSKNN